MTMTMQTMTRAEMETRIKQMTREEKLAELRRYLQNTAMQNMDLENAPDDELEMALIQFAGKVGSVFDSSSYLTAEQYITLFEQARLLHKIHPTLQALGEPSIGVLKK